MPYTPKDSRIDLIPYINLVDSGMTALYLDFYKEAVGDRHLLPHEAAQVLSFVAGRLYSKAVWHAFGYLNALEDKSFQDTANQLIKVMNDGSLHEAALVKGGVHPQLGDTEGEGVYNDIKALEALKKAGCRVVPRRSRRSGN